MLDFTKQYEAEILIKGRPVTEYYHTDGNIYVEGRKGSEYKMRFTNKSNERLCIAPAVDGLSVMDGKEAGLESDGYVVEPHSTLEIPGWRLDNNEVAKFEFNSIDRSYAKQGPSGDTANVGVIGFMVFREFQALSPFKIEHYYSGNSSNMDSMTIGASGHTDEFNGMDEVVGTAWTENSTSGASLSANTKSVTRKLANEVGTKFGEATEFQTKNVGFEKRDSANPDALMVVYYDSLRGLEKRGIHVQKRRGRTSPDPFPNYSGTNSGCTPPDAWYQNNLKR